MCPFCITTIGLIVAGAVSTGGLAALALTVTDHKGDTPHIHLEPTEGSSEHAS